MTAVLPPRRLSVITLYPEMIAAFAHLGTARAANEKGIAEVIAVDLRKYAVDKHGSVDAAPFGGGDSMVLRPEPLAAALASLGDHPTFVISPSPSGVPWSDALARELAELDAPIAFTCGRFAGIDQRFVDRHVDLEVSLGDFILAGGELPALVMIESMLRLMPGVLGNPLSAAHDSFAPALDFALEYPLYTRPQNFAGLSVPDVLLSGNHEAIAAWRKAKAAERTLDFGSRR